MLMSAAEFDAAVEAAATGDKFTYYSGFIMKDRKAIWEFEAQPIQLLAEAAWSALEAGKVTLVQRKLSEGRYHYYAIKRAAPHTPIKWEGCYDTTGYPHKKPRTREDNTTMGAAVSRKRRTRPARAPADLVEAVSGAV